MVFNARVHRRPCLGSFFPHDFDLPSPASFLVNLLHCSPASFYISLDIHRCLCYMLDYLVLPVIDCFIPCTLYHHHISTPFCYTAPSGQETHPTRDSSTYRLACYCYCVLVCILDHLASRRIISVTCNCSTHSLFPTTIGSLTRYQQLASSSASWSTHSPLLHFSSSIAPLSTGINSLLFKLFP